jgi:hypothetical protein
MGCRGAAQQRRRYLRQANRRKKRAALAALFQSSVTLPLRAAARRTGASTLSGLLTALAALLATLVALFSTLLLTLLAALLTLLAGLLALLAGLLALLATLVLLRHLFLPCLAKRQRVVRRRRSAGGAVHAKLFFHVIRYVLHPRRGLERFRAMTCAAPPAGISDLDDLLPAWERKFPHPVHDPILRGLFGIDMNILRAAIGEQPIGDPGTLAQDVFRACVIRQRGI